MKESIRYAYLLRNTAYNVFFVHDLDALDTIYIYMTSEIHGANVISIGPGNAQHIRYMLMFVSDDATFATVHWQ